MTPKELGAVVRERRGKLSVERLAHQAGLTTGAVSRIEAGLTKDPAYRVITRIAMVLGFPGVDAMMASPVVSPVELEEPYKDWRERWESREIRQRAAAGVREFREEAARH